MATITYGKGKILEPTSLKALRASLDQNARDGRIEMPNDKTQSLNDTTPKAFVQVTFNRSIGLRYKKGVSAGPQVMATKPEDKRTSYRVSKNSPAEKKQEVRVFITAPGLDDFFFSKNKKSYSP